MTDRCVSESIADIGLETGGARLRAGQFKQGKSQSVECRLGPRPRFPVIVSLQLIVAPRRTASAQFRAY